MERRFEGFESFVGFLERQTLEVEPAIKLVAGAAAKTLQRRIKAVFGDASKLKSLAPSTQAERVRLGYTPNDPLVRSGGLRDSIEEGSEGMLAGAGSADPVLVFQEFGTGTIPPRPTVEIGLHDSKDEVEEFMQMALDTILGGGVTAKIALAADYRGEDATP